MFTSSARAPQRAFEREEHARNKRVKRVAALRARARRARRAQSVCSVCPSLGAGAARSHRHRRRLARVSSASQPRSAHGSSLTKWPSVLPLVHFVVVVSSSAVAAAASSRETSILAIRPNAATQTGISTSSLAYKTASVQCDLCSSTVVLRPDRTRTRCTQENSAHTHGTKHHTYTTIHTRTYHRSDIQKKNLQSTHTHSHTNDTETPTTLARAFACDHRLRFSLERCPNTHTHTRSLIENPQSSSDAPSCVCCVLGLATTRARLLCACITTCAPPSLCLRVCARFL